MRAVGCAEHRRFAAIVAQKENERAFIEPCLVDRIEHAANRSIEPAHDGRRHPPLAVEMGEAFEIHLEGFLLQMRRHEGKVQKEGLRRMVADKRRGLLGDEIVHPALVHRPFGARGQWRVDVFSRRPDPAAELVKPASERTILALPEMPLADQGGLVAVIAEHLGQQRLPKIEGGGWAIERTVVFDAEPARIATGEDRRAGRRAARRDVGVVADGPRAGEPVEVGGGDVGAAGKAAIAHAEVVDEDHDYIRRRGDRPWGGAADRGDAPRDEPQGKRHRARRRLSRRTEAASTKAMPTTATVEGSGTTTACRPPPNTCWK